MRHPRILIASISLAAVAAIGGGFTAASATSSHASSPPSVSQPTAATVRTAQASVVGKTETILVSSNGLPLYFYVPDTAASSLVSDAHGDQVTYNGHLLYTFADDHPDQVTGHGVQGFFVATPGLTPIGGSSAPAGTSPAVPSGNGYGY